MNNDSILSDANSDVGVITPSYGNMTVMINRMGGRAKDANTVRAVIALGAPDARSAMHAAQETQPFFEKHPVPSAYRLSMVNPQTLRIELEAPTTSPDAEPVYELDFSKL